MVIASSTSSQKVVNREFVRLYLHMKGFLFALTMARHKEMQIGKWHLDHWIFGPEATLKSLLLCNNGAKIFKKPHYRNYD